MLKKNEELKISISSLKQESKNVSNLNTQIQNLYNQISNNAEDIESKKVTISSLHKSAKELENIFENANNHVKQLEKTSIKTINDFINDKTAFADKKFAEYTERTNGKVENNESLQNKSSLSRNL